MRKKALVLVAPTIAFVAGMVMQSCNDTKSKNDAQPAITDVRNLEGEELINRGKYMVTIAGCNDCHSPKVMINGNPADDASRLLSGHPANEPLARIDALALKPGGWALASPGLTAWVGPWGVSYTANLTPDSTSGIGNWDEETFIKTIRTGKHLGQPDGRAILPPMPWFNYSKANDEDLKAIFAYLKSLPPIKNKVPAPLPPDEAIKMASN